MNTQVVLLEINNGIARITLNRPEVFNSFDMAMEKAFFEAWEKCQDDAVRAVILTGMGKAFCAGQDLVEATQEDLMPGFEYLVERRYNAIIKAIYACPKPVIAAVNGVAAGAGANIALACDIVVAHEKASFIQAFSAIGLVPDSGGTYHLPRLVGRSRAMALSMLGEKVTAEDAENMGMIYKVFGDADYETAVNKLAEKLANMPTKALAMTKQLINASADNSLDEQLALESDFQKIASLTHDYCEGVSAFINKRKPEFKGR